MRRFLSNPKWVILLDQAVFSGASFLTTVVLARLLPVATFGTYTGYVLGIYLVMSGVGAVVIQPFQVLVSEMKPQRPYVAFVVWLQAAAVGTLTWLGLGLELVPGIAFPLTVLPFAAGFLLHDLGGACCWRSTARPRPSGSMSRPPCPRWWR